MGFNGIDAILNCLEEDIGYYEDKVSKPILREITDNIANWYLKVREYVKNSQDLQKKS